MWLTASASAGASRSVGRWSCEARAIIYSSGIAEASAIASAAGFACLRRSGRCIPSAIQASISAKSSLDEHLRIDLLQHLAVGVDEADVAAARDPEVGVARLARSVHRAAEHGDLEVLGVGAQPLLDLLRELLHADVVSAAARAGNQDRAALAQAERLQDLEGDADLLDRVGGERDADRVADPVGEQCAQTDCALDRARARRPRLGHTEVQRIRHTSGQHPVGADHRRHVARLDRDLEVAVVEHLEQPHLLERGLDERLGLILLGKQLEVPGQGAGVGADPHRDARLLRRLNDLGHLVVAADVPGVDADGGDAGLDRLEREARVEVDVGDHGQRREPHDQRQRLGVLELRHRHAHDLAAGARELGDLRRRRGDVVRLRQRHRLDSDRRTTADRDIAYPD